LFAVKGPDISHQLAQCQPSTGWKSAIDQPDQRNFSIMTSSLFGQLDRSG
jgi:hypothetical protein